MGEHGRDSLKDHGMFYVLSNQVIKTKVKDGKSFNRFIYQNRFETCLFMQKVFFSSLQTDSSSKTATGTVGVGYLPILSNFYCFEKYINLFHNQLMREGWQAEFVKLYEWKACTPNLSWSSGNKILRSSQETHKNRNRIFKSLSQVNLTILALRVSNLCLFTIVFLYVCVTFRWSYLQYSYELRSWYTVIQSFDALTYVLTGFLTYLLTDLKASYLPLTQVIFVF